MRKIIIVTIVVGLSLISVKAQESCLQPENLKKLDTSWEKAQLESDKETLSSLLHEDFIWVHNHASAFDNKTAVLNRALKHKNSGTKNARSRTSKDVTVIVSGATGIVSGYTIVDRGPRPTKYHFMRTYVATEGKCLLIANHTMAIPEED